MRKNTSILLLCAGIVLSLAGCQKGITPGGLAGKAVRFGATSGSLNTRSDFTGDGTQDGTKTDEFGRKILTHERINWTVGDQVMIASDNATVYQDPTTKFATYSVASFTENGDKSYATLDEKAGSEELFFTDAETYKFWGVYPATIGNGAKLVSAQANYSISGSQAPTGTPTTSNVTVDGVAKTLTTLKPDMAQAVMLAAAENQTTQNVELEFYPGFTAFEFTLNSAEADIILKELVLKPASADKSLAGDVAVNAIKVGGNTFNSADNYTITYPETKPVTYTFPANTKITKTDYVTFTVFALPETIEGLTLEFHLGEDGSEIQTATLKQKVNGEKQNISFAGCKKHCLRGIAVKGGWNFTYLTLDIDVLDWVAVEIEESNGKGVQATQFAVSDNAQNLRYMKTPNDKDYRQCWVFSPTTEVTTGEGDEAVTTTETTEITVTYKIMMPESGTWGIEKCGDTGDFTVTVTSSGGTVTSSGNSYSGALSAGATYITITISSTATAVKTLYFKTTASDGTSTFSLDSETQLYDMRGYHYFIVNGTAATTFADLNI